MKRTKGTSRDRALVAIISAVLLLMSFLQPVATVAADQYLRLRITDAVNEVQASRVEKSATNVQSITPVDASVRLNQVIDANICLTLLNHGIIDGSGYLRISGTELISTLTTLVLTGQLSLGSILNVNALVSLLQDGGCVTPQPTQPPPPPPTAVPTQAPPPPTAVPTKAPPPPTAVPTLIPVQPTAVPTTDSGKTDPEPTSAPDPTKASGGSQPDSQRSGGVNVDARTSSSESAPQAVADVDLCLVLLGEDIIDLDGSIVVDLDELPMILARLILTGQIDVGSILSLDALIQILTDGGCASLPADSTDPDSGDADATDGVDTGDADAADDVDTGDAADTADTDATDSTDGTDTPIVDLDVCATLLVNNIIDFDGNLVVNGAELVNLLTNLVASGDLSLGEIADIDALVEILEGGGCAVAQPADATDSDATDTDATDTDASDADTTDADATDSTDGEDPPVVDAEICAVLLSNNIIDAEGNLVVNASQLSTLLGTLISEGDLDLGTLLTLDVLIAALVDGTACGATTDADATDTDATDTDATDTDATDADTSDADATDSTDGEDPPVVDAEICAVLLSNNIIDAEGNLVVDASQLSTLLGTLISEGDLDLGTLLTLDVLIAALVDGTACGATTDADATDTDATDTDATDADTSDADATDSTDGEDPPVVDAEICAVLLSNNIIDAEGNLVVDASQLSTLLGTLISEGDLDLGTLLTLDVLIAALVDGTACGATADATDTDATDADSTDTDATDTDATDADATDADAADSTDADTTDTDATDVDSTDSDATDGDDSDATDSDGTDADTGDADSTDADATDADTSDADATDTDGNDSSTGIVNVFVYACESPGVTNLEYKNSSEPAEGAANCGDGTATLTFTSVESGTTYTVSMSAGVSNVTVHSAMMQLDEPATRTITGTGVVQMPAGTYQVALEGTGSVLTIQIAEGDANPMLVVTNQGEAKESTTPVGVTGLPDTGTGGDFSGLVWPLTAIGTVLLLLGGQYTFGVIRRRND